jgi:peptidoglycan/LPS O-acetylase OafA/YrhL
MDPGVSSYLNLLRIVASLTVLLTHYTPTLFGAAWNLFPGHDAVIIFFVLSGYVIAYVSETRDRPLARFVIHRLARLWSVLIPAIGVAAIAAIMVPVQGAVSLGPLINSPLAFSSASLRNALFLGEWWVARTAAPYNFPMWSLNYEAWYYAIFAAFVFSPPRWRWIAAGSLVLLSGPHIPVLFPCWLLGAWLYRRHAGTRIRAHAAYALFGACVLLYAVAYHFDLTLRSRDWLSALTAGESYHFGAADSVIGDSLISLIVAATIFAVPSMPAFNRLFVRARRITQIAASRTLSLYLYHMPLLVILYDGLGVGKRGMVDAVLCLALGIGCAVLIGGVTEAKLDAWRKALARVYSLIKPKEPRTT